MKGFTAALGLGLVLGASGPAWAADTVSGTIQDGYGRLAFTTDSKVSATTTGGVLAISFSAKTNLDPAIVAGNSRRWWRNSGLLLNRAFPIRYFDQLGVPRLAA